MIRNRENCLFALVDANNFFVSCERLFNPTLLRKPVVVLSNNDGCFVARSEEAKQLGLPMGAPYFKYRKIIEDNNVAVFSSNYQLYGNISKRIMHMLGSLVPDIEVYSIDEAFLRLDRLQGVDDILEYAEYVRKKVEQCVGIPLSMGIAPTKLLAKVASHASKKAKTQKAFNLGCPLLQTALLRNLPVEKLWGVGSRRQKRLNSLGIHTALDLRESDSKLLRKKLSVVGERMVWELRGISCLALEDTAPRKNITCSRSFGRPINNIGELEEAIANYTSQAAVKLRNQGSKAQGMYVFLRTSRYNGIDQQYSGGTVRNFIIPTNDTRKLVAAAKDGLSEIYSPQYKYQKTGIILLNLIPEDNSQQNFLAEIALEEKSSQLMSTIDRINNIFGKDTVFIASQGIKRPWQMKTQMRSNRFTTKWSEMCIVS